MTNIPDDIKKLRDEWISKFAQQLPGSFDFGEAQKCWDAGYELQSSKLAELREKILEIRTLVRNINYEVCNEALDIIEGTGAK